VLGAGGAARAVVYGLLLRGAERIAVANRSAERADSLRQRFGQRVQPALWDKRDGLLAQADLLVNATTLGMARQEDLVLDAGRLPSRAVVADLVYVPMVTPLLRAAAARGLRTADGLGMLLHQAVRGFVLWFGKKPDITPDLRAMVEADLALPV